MTLGWTPSSTIVVMAACRNPWKVSERSSPALANSRSKSAFRKPAPEDATPRTYEDQAFGITSIDLTIFGKMSSKLVDEERRSRQGSQSGIGLGSPHDRNMSGRFLDDLRNGYRSAEKVDVSDAQSNGLSPTQPKDPGHEHQGL